MDFLIMILVADVVSFCFMLGAICFSMLILDRFGFFDE